MPSEAGFEMPPAGSNLGLLAARISRVPAATCGAVGAGMRSSDPSYCRELNEPFLSAVLPTPLMLSTRNEPSEATAMAEGNHAVGMAPDTCHLPPGLPAGGCRTAMALLQIGR